MRLDKILVVDDSRLVHRLMQTMLKGKELVGARSGLEGLAVLEDNPDTDLILLDINMPEMNGLEFLERVKSDPALSGIPVIIVSTEGKEEDTERGLAAGAAAYVKKPFRPDELHSVIDSLSEKVS